jgi:hypothetical protein
MSMVEEPEFQAAMARTQAEIEAKMSKELCPHGRPIFEADWRRRELCPECEQAAAKKAEGWWSSARQRMDGVKEVSQTDFANSSFDRNQADPAKAQS